MKVIWKYPLQLVEIQLIQMPFDADILCVQTQKGVPTIWAFVNPEAPTLSRKIRLIPTGVLGPEEIYAKLDYIGTFLMQNDELVFHVFEEFQTSEMQTS